jgi:hypothetical protein
LEESLQNKKAAGKRKHCPKLAVSIYEMEKACEASGNVTSIDHVQ